MACYSPIYLENPKYKFMPKTEYRYNAVPCGRCVDCLESRRAEWTLRIEEELKQHIDAQFITLTYSDENLTYGEKWPTLYKPDFQAFMKRLRTNVDRSDYPSKLRFYAIGEYGTTTLRPHYHVILFGLSRRLIEQNIIEKSWQLGHIHVGNVQRGSIHYVTKYHVNKGIYPPGSERGFALMSRRPAIGANYLKSNGHLHNSIDKAYYQDGNYRKKLPRYYREKLFTKAQRKLIAEKSEKLAIEKMEEKIAHHEKNNKDRNMYDLEIQKIKQHVRRYREKINKSSKI